MIREKDRLKLEKNRKLIGFVVGGRPVILALLGAIIITANAFFVFSWIYHSWTELSIVIIESTPDSIRKFVTDKCTCCCKTDRKISYINRQRLKILEQVIMVENNMSNIN